jgi:hypothetical protein
MPESTFAVAVRDGEELFLSVRIKRNDRGEIFVLLPTGGTEPGSKKWNAHASYHENGWFHYKSFGRKRFWTKRQKPDANFTGTTPPLILYLAPDELRALGELCNSREFSDVMEIPIDLLRNNETCLSIDVIAPDAKPIFAGPILRQRPFKDAVPWILVTLYRVQLPS